MPTVTATVRGLRLATNDFRASDEETTFDSAALIAAAERLLALRAPHVSPPVGPILNKTIRADADASQERADEEMLQTFCIAIIQGLAEGLSQCYPSGDDDYFDYYPAAIDLLSDAGRAYNTIDDVLAPYFVLSLLTCDRRFDPQTQPAAYAPDSAPHPARYLHFLCLHQRSLDSYVPAWLDDLEAHDWENCPRDADD